MWRSEMCPSTWHQPWVAAVRVGHYRTVCGVAGVSRKISREAYHGQAGVARGVDVGSAMAAKHYHNLSSRRIDHRKCA